MKNKVFIIYNLVLFIIFAYLTILSLGDISGLTQLNEFAITIFSLLGILSQLIIINFQLAKSK